MLLLDLDRFKYINDFHGHSAGDEVVRTIGRTLTGVVSDDRVVARLGGDEFAVLLPGADRDTAERVAERILEAVRAQELTLGTLPVSTTASIGVVPFGHGDAHVDDVLAAADMAMYAAKEAGGNRSHVSRRRRRVRRRACRRASRGPTRSGARSTRTASSSTGSRSSSCSTGVATHREVLLRMVGDDGEIIPPGAFIEHRRALRPDPGDRPLGRAAAIRLLARRPRGDGRIEVNLSGKSIGDPRAARADRARARAVGRRPGPARVRDHRDRGDRQHGAGARLRRAPQGLGCRFALDDFGAGFSSFYYLKHLPLDYLKIDGDFIRGLTSSHTDQLVVSSMVDIARGMGMKTIAEFVEDAETARCCARWASTTPRATTTGARCPWSNPARV